VFLGDRYVAYCIIIAKVYVLDGHWIIFSVFITL